MLEPDLTVRCTVRRCGLAARDQLLKRSEDFTELIRSLLQPLEFLLAGLKLELHAVVARLQQPILVLHV